MPDPNNDLVELCLILDALRDYNPSEITTVVPYLAYARQDKRFKEGEVISSKLVLKILNEFSDRIITVNCHFLIKKGF